MKTLTMRELNRRTAQVLNSVEQGETFEVRRSGRTVGYLSRTAPAKNRQPDWKAHFEWLKKQPKPKRSALDDLMEERRRLIERERQMEEC